MFVRPGRLDAELLAVTRRVSNVLRMLPKDITPVNLEELRRVKQLLVELESKADTLRCVSLQALGLCASVLVFVHCSSYAQRLVVDIQG